MEPFRPHALACHPGFSTDQKMQYCSATSGMSPSLHPTQSAVTPRVHGTGQWGRTRGKTTASIPPGGGYHGGRFGARWVSSAWAGHHHLPPQAQAGFQPLQQQDRLCLRNCAGWCWQWIQFNEDFCATLFLRAIPKKCSLNTRITQFSTPFVSLQVIRVSLDGAGAKNHSFSLPITSLESIHTNFFSFSPNKDPQWHLWFIQ